MVAFASVAQSRKRKILRIPLWWRQSNYLTGAERPSEATVGIAMGQGTDVALETADVTLMTSDLSRLLEVLAISKRCYRVIMFNFWGTIIVDTVGIALAFFGLLAPIMAALIHVGSELAFILNSARLFRAVT
jgi:P-type Cu+ transporter